MLEKHLRPTARYGTRVSGGAVRAHLRRSGRRRLCSVAHVLLHTPRCCLSACGVRAFSYAGPSAWNSLPENLRASDLSLNSFRHSLKTFLLTQTTHAAH